MKKIFAILTAVIMVFALSACTDNAETEQGADEQVERIVYEDDVFKASFLGVDDLMGVQGMSVVMFRLENKTDGEITVYPKDTSVNGGMVLFTSGIPAEMTGGKYTTQSWTFVNENVGISTAEDIKNVDISFYVVDENTEEIETTESVSINVVE